MEYLVIVLMILLVAEVFLILSNLSSLRRELKEHLEKMASELADIKNSLQSKS